MRPDPCEYELILEGGTSDICCQAACVGVPCPNDLQANQTTDCAAQCVQGNGTEEETAAYAACQSSCISSLFFPLSATAGGSAATGTGASASDATATATETGIGKYLFERDSHRTNPLAGADESSASETDAAASASSTSDSGNGAARNTVAGFGLLGLVIAALAL